MHDYKFPREELRDIKQLHKKIKEMSKKHLKIPRKGYLKSNICYY